MTIGASKCCSYTQILAHICPSNKQSQDISYRQKQARPDYVHNEVQAHLSTSTRHPTSLFAQWSDVAFRRNPSTKHKTIARHLVSSQTSTSRDYGHNKVQALSKQAHPSINSTSRSHSLPDVQARHSGQTSPPSTKQLQDKHAQTKCFSNDLLIF
uniref:Uncharacterized protein n=1 Tax=Cucumis melo TaxID=3656 RepID=A0A9I9D8Q2_CUCME